MRTHVYIDGFNLYYGLLRGTAYKWIDLEKFCDQLLPKNTVEKIYYFTAKVDARQEDPDQPIRQLAFLNALASLPRVEVHLGNFMSSVVAQPVVDTNPTGGVLRVGGKPVLKRDPAGNVILERVLKSEEKGSDVNLASYLLKDAYQGACECAVIISNDSDLLTPIRMAKNDGGLVIGLVPPRPKGSVELKTLADFKIDPRIHVLASSQFPDPLPTPSGLIHKPANW
ncbi:NYN domain-containing protein [Rhizobium laguerreae]|uniref:NYN domain-containing protein n=1 Tax=Rhizobium laguerreae TaxID=1076926 RepID=UPI001C91B217|nr:NYN domain-containing protein [Rhizobium laguerreae]MBY3094911.1 NYN domain-containing protein [Rhizobium laguerreae]MBY3164821.1 NYN domain-containing protein [Rhizobium laguerreae]